MPFDQQPCLTGTTHIAIDQQHLAAGLRKGNSQVQNGGALTLAGQTTGQAQPLTALAGNGKTDVGTQGIVGLLDIEAAIGAQQQTALCRKALFPIGAMLSF